MSKFNYRKLWSDHYGDIPIDENGVTYDIHHIDGNRNNNAIDNLIAISIMDHYKIHLNQGDIASAHRISSRINLTDQERSHINKLISEYNKGRKRKDVSIKNSESIGEKNHMFGKKNVFRSEQNKKQTGENNPRARAVLQYNIDGKFIKEYSTVKEANKAIQSSKVGEVCRGLRPHTRGFIFKFKN